METHLRLVFVCCWLFSAGAQTINQTLFKVFSISAVYMESLNLLRIRQVCLSNWCLILVSYCFIKSNSFVPVCVNVNIWLSYINQSAHFFFLSATGKPASNGLIVKAIYMCSTAPCLCTYCISQPEEH